MEYLSLNSLRRFGAEIEINSFDMLNRPIGYQDGVLPTGIHYIGNLVKKATNNYADDYVLIHKWGNDHHNNCWIIKPDGSCGIEVCTPVLKGWRGILQVCQVIDSFKDDPKVSADSRCSFHVHVDVSDLSEEKVAGIIAWWVKCEAVFMDAMPPKRKNNHYCQFLGMTDIFENMEDGLIQPSILIKQIGHCKYYSLNTFHYVQKKRKTIEFRIMDNDSCKDSWSAKNWLRLVLHFVNCAVQKGIPNEYQPGDQWSGYSWLDPEDVFKFLGFSEDFDLSPGANQVKSWFLSRILKYSLNSGFEGVMSDFGRSISRTQAINMGKSLENFIPTKDDIYSEKFRI